MSDQTQNVSENDIRADEAVNENIEKVNAVKEQAFETAEAAADAAEKKKTIPQIIFGSVIWALVLSYLLLIAGQLLGDVICKFLPGRGTDLGDTALMYFSFIGIWIVFLINAALKKNRPLFKAYGTGCKGNRPPQLLIGLLIGFAMNGLCILMAIAHGDIHLYFDRFEVIPFIILLFSVFVQSSAEEVTCRGFAYQRILKTHRKQYMIAIFATSVFFGAIHLLNPGVGILPIIDIILSGLIFAFMVYYFDSLWMAMGVHTGWNFTQSILAGLPNSGIVVPYSNFKLEASTAISSPFYDVAFGIEGSVAAIVVQAITLAIIILIGRKLNEEPTDIWEGQEG